MVFPDYSARRYRARRNAILGGLSKMVIVNWLAEHRRPSLRHTETYARLI